MFRNIFLSLFVFLFGTSLLAHYPIGSQLIVHNKDDKSTLFLEEEGRIKFQDFLVGGLEPEFMKGLKVVSIKHLDWNILEVVVENYTPFYDRYWFKVATVGVLAVGLSYIWRSKIFTKSLF